MKSTDKLQGSSRVPDHEGQSRQEATEDSSRLRIRIASIKNIEIQTYNAVRNGNVILFSPKHPKAKAAIQNDIELVTRINCPR